MRLSVVAASVLAGLAAVSGSVPATASAADRYAFANGCYAVTDAGGARVADAVFMKPTALGRYLLYRADRTFVAAQDGRLATAAAPSPAADFALEEAGGASFRLVPQSTGAAAATVTFAPGPRSC